jgi:hypothetical protein
LIRGDRFRRTASTARKSARTALGSRHRQSLDRTFARTSRSRPHDESDAASSRSLRRVAFSSSSLKSPSLIFAKPRVGLLILPARLAVDTPAGPCWAIRQLAGECGRMHAGAPAQNEAPLLIIGPNTRFDPGGRTALDRVGGLRHRARSFSSAEG